MNTRHVLIRIKKWLLRSIFAFVGLLCLYGLSFWILSYLPASFAKVQKTGEVAIYVHTDGFHTDIILPAQTAWKNWREQINFEQEVNYYAFGWGDRGFYLQTPQAENFQSLTAGKALFYLGTAVVHITHYKALTENEQCKKIWLSATQYKKLVQFIHNAFVLKEDKYYQPILQHTYGKRHLFFEAKGGYSLFYTCNTWVNEALKASQ